METQQDPQVDQETAQLRAELEQEIRNKRRCAYASFECTQLSLENYKYCSRHILEDKNAPFKQCTYVYAFNGKRCHLAAPKSGGLKEYNYCSEHALRAALERSKRGSKGPPVDTPEATLADLTHYVNKSGNGEGELAQDDGVVTCSNDPFNKKLNIYLNFNGRLTSETTQNQIFFHAVNLHKPHPLIQINGDVFRGTYDTALGTNLFFKYTRRDNQNVDAFKRKFPVTLDYFITNFKILNLKMVKIEPKKPEISNEIEKIYYNFNWDYETLLKKFENGSLKLEDFIAEEPQTTNVGTTANEKQECLIEENNQLNDENNQLNDENNQLNDENNQFNDENNEILEYFQQKVKHDYLNLRQLALKPTKRKKQNELFQCNEKYVKKYEYDCIEREILKPCDHFRQFQTLEINNEMPENFLNINRCILYGILEPTIIIPRYLTDNEMKTVLKINNFDNLSLLARLFVLEKHKENMEHHIQNLSKDEWSVKDEFGRNKKETLEIYGKLCETLCKRCAEIKSCL